jgi:hypothetical protein
MPSLFGRFLNLFRRNEIVRKDTAEINEEKETLKESRI